MELSLRAAAVVATVALLAPLAVRLARVRLPEVVLQIVLGVVVGPQVLGWARVDEPVRVLALIGLAFLLLLAGMEIDFERLRGAVLRVTAAAFALSFAIAALLGVLLAGAGLVRSPLLIAVILSATSLGIVLPVLSDAGQLGTAFGQVVVAGASIAEVVPIVVLSLLFSAGSAGVGARAVLLVTFLLAVVAVGVLLAGLERIRWLSRTLLALQDTTAQVRVRGAMALLLAFAATAAAFGLESILGAFLAGAALTLLDRDPALTHVRLRGKLQAVGFGAFVPFFFVSTGMALDVGGLVRSPAALARIPLFLAALLLARAVPAVLYARFADDRRQLAAAGLLQATSLSIPVVAGQIGVDLGLLRPENEVALVAAGLLSVVAFPLLAVTLLGAPRPRPSDGLPSRGPSTPSPPLHPL